MILRYISTFAELFLLPTSLVTGPYFRHQHRRFALVALGLPDDKNQAGDCRNSVLTLLRAGCQTRDLPITSMILWL